MVPSSNHNIKKTTALPIELPIEQEVDVSSLPDLNVIEKAIYNMLKWNSPDLMLLRKRDMLEWELIRDTNAPFKLFFWRDQLLMEWARLDRNGIPYHICNCSMTGKKHQSSGSSQRGCNPILGNKRKIL
ncbi:hypothetical protein CEXT_150521 [Caerostris extrusa]|uniref:Ycf15 n=1 Tax=Caerostris extrusa TaxID=172846 RepID=A0AAV4QDJ7_CAEEX|nr:hypothetical protein CEXT_150521 [Caerostris extrusa]